jgi:hypothetical protein
MNLMTFCIAPLVLSAAPLHTMSLHTVSPHDPADPVLSALVVQDDAALGELRGGAPEEHAALAGEELAALRAADAAATDLADLRGGTLDDHDLTVIAVVALAIIAIAIIL